MREIASAVLLLVLSSLPALAQSARTEVAAQLKVVSDVKAEDGFAPDQAALGRSTLLGVLEHDSSVYLEVTLEAGREYHIAGRCDTGCQNLDLRLLAPDFSPVAEDTLENDQPKMETRAADSGAHLLAVRMTSCPEKICYFGVVILSRPARGDRRN